MKRHQISHTTEYNRYPNIFQICAEYFKKKSIKILSFGCSDGAEVFSLKDLYFPTSEIHGVDISKDIIEVCKSKNNDPSIKFSHTNEIYKSQKAYNLIFCMSVFCRWPQTSEINDCSSKYPFKMFQDQLIDVDKHLLPKGLLVIYNANFCFSELDIYPQFTPLTDKRINESGFVHKFNSKNQKIDFNYKDCIFIKK